VAAALPRKREEAFSRNLRGCRLFHLACSLAQHVHRYDDCGLDSAPDPTAVRAAQRLGGGGVFVDFDGSLMQHPPLWATLAAQRAEKEAESKAKKAEANEVVEVDAAAGGGSERRLGGTAWSGVSYPCGNDAALAAYLKDPAVMAALHVNKSLSGQSYHSTAGDLRPLYKTLAAKYKLVIYSGDSDLCVPYTYSSWWTEGLGFDTAKDWHSWSSPSLHGSGNAVGGYAIEYAVPDSENSLYFVTVKGSGHMVPQYVETNTFDRRHERTTVTQGRWSGPAPSPLP
jgi:hypothetical protein